MKKVLFISTRFGKTDGVSLETEKADQVFRKLGFESYYLAAELPHYQCKGKVLDLCNFAYPTIYELNNNLVNKESLDTSLLYSTAQMIEDEIIEYINEIKPDLISLQNSLAIPMNLPLGIAITNALKKTGIVAYSHNHDYYWERQRFIGTQYEKLLSEYFPPNLPNLVNASINTQGQNELLQRKNINSILIPNVFDFDATSIDSFGNVSPLNELDEYNKHFKSDFDIYEDKIVFIQPTRLVRRKGIERSILLISKLPQRESIVLVLTGYAGDEVDTYEEEIVILARNLGVNTRFVGNRILDRRLQINNHRYYTLWDAFVNSDFCTIPSDIEGFCNHFTESCYFKKPIFINEYPVFKSDIKNEGFNLVEVEGAVTEDAIKKVDTILKDRDLYNEVINHNYELAKRIYSYDTLSKNLREILSLLKVEL